MNFGGKGLVIYEPQRGLGGLGVQVGVGWGPGGVRGRVFTSINKILRQVVVLSVY